MLNEKNPSVAFSKISKLLENWLAGHPPYQKAAEGLDPQFFAKLKEIADMRNALAHGHLREHDPQSGSFTVGILKRIGRDTWLSRIDRYEWKALEALASLSNQANRELIKLADQLFFPKDDQRSERP